MKLKLIIIQLCLSFSSLLYSADLIDISLKDFIVMVSKDQNITILVDKDLDDKITLTVSSKIKKGDYFSALKMVLEGKKLKLVKKANIYYIEDTTLDYRIIKLNFTKYEDIKSIIETFDLKDKIQYIPNTNSLLTYSSFYQYKKIKDVIAKIDKLPNQKKLKVTIIDTNLDKLKERGMQNTLNMNSDSNTNFFYNLVAFPFTVTNTINPTQSTNFYSFIKLLNEDKTTKLVSSPILTISDSKKTIFQVVKNIPYLEGESKIDNDNSKVTSSYKYKDIGLTLSVIPKILDSNIVYLELELNVSNLLSLNNNLPITSKKFIKQNFYLETGKLFVLTGINRTESKSIENELPLLKDIPYLGWLFKYKTNEENNSNLSIILEVIDDGKK